MAVSIIIALALSVSGLSDGVSAEASVCTAATLGSSDVPVPAAVDSIVPSLREPDALRLVAVEQFDQPCAGLIRASLMGLVKLADSRVFQRTVKERNYSLLSTSRGFGEDGYDRRTAAEKLLPQVDGKGLLSSHRVNARRGRGGDFVGVWRVRKKWLVASFSQRDDGSFTTPQAILTSLKPIRSVNYLPAPDTNAGRLELLQERPAGRVWSLAFDWTHNMAFRGP